MKKIIALLLVLVFCLSFAACGTTSSGTPASGPANSAPASVSPAASTVPSDSPQATVPASAPPSTKITAESMGFFSDGVDPSSRKTYNILVEYGLPISLLVNITDAMKQYSKKLNFKLTTQCANMDLDKYVQDLQVAIDQGTDGFILCTDPSISERINEIMKAANKPYIALLTTILDDKGALLAPCINLNPKTCADATVQWLFDNYKTYWGDIDTNKIGLISFTLSVSPDFQNRYLAAIAKFKELFPNNSNIFTADAISSSSSNPQDPQVGYDMAAAIFTAHSEIKYWFVATCLEQYAQGASRAAESLDMEKNVLVTTIGSDLLVSEWDGGYNGCFVSCLGVSKYQYSAPAVCGLIAILDGKATSATLWADRITTGQKYATYDVNNHMITKDTYKAYFDDIDQAVNSWIN